jgi:trehalose 6-phosphate phosphatase
MLRKSEREIHMRTMAVERADHGWFFRALSAAKQRILMVDYDGTVAPFSRDRRRASPYPTVPELLSEIMTACRTRLIIVSGRSARDVPRLLRIHPPPEIWGSHGVERLYPDGRYEEMNVNDDAVQALAEAEMRLDEQCLGPHIEVKLAALAVHWRGLDSSKALKVRSRAYETLEPMVSRADLTLAEFDGGVELRLRSANKGDAVGNFLRHLDPAIPVAYLGDDIDDEGAFRVLNGRGLTVLVKSKRRFTAAQMWLRPPEELVGFLIDWKTTCGGKQ